MVAPEQFQSPEQRREALKQVLARARECVRCPELAAARRSVVFGSGNADADLMFVGEAPGASEDEQGLPFVGRAGKLLDTLLREIGLARADVFIANTLMCRPPGNRDPLPIELENCHEYLYQKVALIQPRVICTLGNFATKLLRGDPTGITRLHGRSEELTLGARTVWLYPVYHPAAALRTPAMLQALREDFAALPELLSRPAPPQPDELPELPVPEAEADLAASGGAKTGADVAAPGGAGAEADLAASGGAKTGADLAAPGGAEAARERAVDQLGLF